MFDLLILTLSLVNLLTNSAYSSIAPFYPLEAANKGVNPLYIGFIFSVYSLTKSIVAPLVGQLMAKTGRKVMIFSGLTLEGTAIICFGLIDFIPDGTTYGILSAVCRVFEGAGNAWLITSSYALVASHYPDHKEDVIGTLQVFTGIGLMVGPLLGSALYAIGGFQLPFYVTGAGLFILLILTFFTLPSKENYAPDMRWSPNSGVLKKNELTYLECLANVRVIMIASIVTLSLLQLTFREPILQFRLLDLGVDPKYAGLFFALDLVGYIGVSFILPRIPKEKKNLPFLVYLSMFLAIFGLFFVGTIHVIGLPDSLTPLIIGILINGTAGALCINNSVAAMINILNITYANRGELVNNIASGIFASCFSLGEMLGPICGSVLTGVTGGFSSGVFVINIAVTFVAMMTTYHLAGDVLCWGQPSITTTGRIPGKEQKALIHDIKGEGQYARLDDEFSSGDEEENIEFDVKEASNGLEVTFGQNEKYKEQKMPELSKKLIK